MQTPTPCPPRRTITLGAALTFLCIAAPIAAGQTTTQAVIARTGDDAVGVPAATFSDIFGRAHIVEGERILFRALVSGPGISSSNDLGIWRWDDGELELVIREGDEISIIGQPNRRITSLNAPEHSDSGSIAFTGNSELVSGGDERLSAWLVSTAGITEIVTEGMAVPDSGGLTLDSFGVRGINAQDDVLISVTSQPGSVRSNAIYRAGALELVAYEGQPFPDGSSDLIGNLAPALSENGDVTTGGLFAGTSSSGGAVALRPGGLEAVLRTGDETDRPGVPAGLVERPAINGDGRILMVGALDLTGFTDALFLEQPGAPAAVVIADGDPAPGFPGAVFDAGPFFRSATLSDAGTIGLEAFIEGPGIIPGENDAVIWRGSADDLQPVARTGSAAPDTSADYRSFSVPFFGSQERPTPEQNRSGNLLFYASLTGAGIDEMNDEGLWVAPAGDDPILIIREGQTFDLGDKGAPDLQVVAFDDSFTTVQSSSSGSDGRRRTLSNNDSLVVTFLLADGREAIALIAYGDPTTCPVDLDGSGTVDFGDLLLVIANFASTSPAGDANEDGIVDFEDLTAVLASFGSSCG